MQRISCRMTVFFDPPYWVAVIERREADRLTACKITLGAEPKDYDLYALVLTRWHTFSFSPAMQGDIRERTRPVGPKRMQRQISKALQQQGAGTKAQQALKAQHEETKHARKALSAQEKEAQRKRQFSLKQQKKREKHRGH